MSMCENFNAVQPVIKKTLIKTFPAPDLRRQAAYFPANPRASAKNSKESLIKSPLS